MTIRSPFKLAVAAAVLLLVVMVLAPPQSLAQRKSIKQYFHQIWSSANGLPQNSADDIVQTSDGYIWFGTEDGLARFDGVEFTVFDRANTKEFPNSWMVRLLEDGEGGLWMRPTGFAPGLVRYANGSFTSYRQAQGLAHDQTLTWEADKHGTTWIGTLGGLSEFKGGKFKTYTTKEGLPSDTVFGLGLDSEERLWISTTRGLACMTAGKIETLTGRPDFPDTVILRTNGLRNIFQDSHKTVWMSGRRDLIEYKDGAYKRYAKSKVLPSSVINDIREDRKGDLWFATDSGLARYSGGRFTPYKASVDRDENKILQIDEDREGSLWLMTGRGIARFADGSFEKYQQKDGLSDNTLQKMLIDKEGSIWVSSYGGGIDRFRDEKFITYSSRVGLSYDNTQCVMEDRTGALWIGTTSGGLNRMKDGVMTVYDSRNGLPDNLVSSLGEDSEGNIWVSTEFGVSVFKDGRFTRRSAREFPGLRFPGSVFRLLKSDTFLIGSGNRVSRLSAKSMTPEFSIDSVATTNNQVRDLFEDSRGTLWVSTLQHTYWWREGKLTMLDTVSAFPAGTWLIAFYEDPKGVIWLGTGGGGIFRFKDDKFVNISPAQGLFDYTAYVIFEDSSGYFWMSCNKGPYRVSKKELNDVADGLASTVHSVAYGTVDGMETRECNGGNPPCGWQTRDGRICFSTPKGLAVINPADIRINQIPPPVVIDRFFVEGERQDTRTTVRVLAGKSRFEFHYAGISFVGGDKVRYKYQLVGLDKEWIDAGGRREAFYTHLDPGEYTFRVIAANSDGIWNETGASVSFELRPFFYQTSWFIGLAAFAFLTIGPSYYLLRLRRLQKRKAELEKLVSVRTGELQHSLENLKETQNQLILSEKMASLGQLTAGIAHEIKNPLNFITNFAVLSEDRVKDLRVELLAERDRVDPKRAEEIADILGDLEQNVVKINEHGKRADSIVRGMLLHSRGKAGERQETDLVALLAEYTNLAYHGMRAQDTTFNVKIETDFDPSIGKVSVVPQDLSRAFLNIVNNACYAANDKRRTARNGFSPVVRVSARNVQGAVEIRIRDNGNGIPLAIREKIFNPFFTTKPAGVGTGLGLSLSYDIITQVHKGELRVDTEEGQYTEFVILIPRTQDNGERHHA